MGRNGQQQVERTPTTAGQLRESYAAAAALWTVFQTELVGSERSAIAFYTPSRARWGALVEPIARSAPAAAAAAANLVRTRFVRFGGRPPAAGAGSHSLVDDASVTSASVPVPRIAAFGLEGIRRGSTERSIAGGQEWRART